MIIYHFNLLRVYIYIYKPTHWSLHFIKTVFKSRSRKFNIWFITPSTERSYRSLNCRLQQEQNILRKCNTSTQDYTYAVCSLLVEESSYFFKSVYKRSPTPSLLWQLYGLDPTRTHCMIRKLMFWTSL